MKHTLQHFAIYTGAIIFWVLSISMGIFSGSQVINFTHARGSIFQAEKSLENIQESSIDREEIVILERYLESQRDSLRITKRSEDLYTHTLIAESIAQSAENAFRSELHQQKKYLGSLMQDSYNLVEQASNVDLPIDHLLFSLEEKNNLSDKNMRDLEKIRDGIVEVEEMNNSLKMQIEEREKQMIFDSILDEKAHAEELFLFFEENVIHQAERNALFETIRRIDEFANKDLSLQTRDSVKEFAESVSSVTIHAQSIRNDLDEEYLAKRKEWIERENQKRAAGNFAPAPTPPVDAGKVAYIIIGEQTMYLYDRGELIYSTPVTTGKSGFATVTGDFTMYAKRRNVRLISPFTTDKESPLYYDLPVRYWMPFYGGYGLHDAPWRRIFGGADYQWAGSHGCVNLSGPAADFLWEWSDVGMPVIVRSSR